MVRRWTIAFAQPLAALVGCAVHAVAPTSAPHDPSGGFAPAGFDEARACSAWREAVGTGAGAAIARRHDSFAELDPQASCFVAVRTTHAGAETSVRPDPTPPGCGYPGEDVVSARTAVEHEADRAEALGRGEDAPRPIELACDLPPSLRAVAARSNARTYRALLGPRREAASYPYAAILTFGYGFRAQSDSALVTYAPGDACPSFREAELPLYSVDDVRAARASQAYRGGVAPVIVVSGGAVHSNLIEAFLLHYLLTCRFGVPPEAVLLDPCADHTHTNLRNTGAMLRAIGGRTAYVVTDDTLQAAYLEEWTLFDLIGGSLDQRALRDFGHLLGAYRRASVGMRGGFWYTPYRFWAEPKTGLGGFSCVP